LTTPYRRIQFTPGQYYHIYNRGSGHRSIFREQDNYLFVLRLVKKYASAFDISVIAYCLMPNHYHFLLRQDGTEAAGLLPQRVFNSYTKAFNKRYDCSGTLFEGRYEAIHVDKEGYLLHLCRYIHANPVKDGLDADTSTLTRSKTGWYRAWRIGPIPTTMNGLQRATVR